MASPTAASGPDEIECSKRSAIDDIRTGAAKRLPACVDLRTCPMRVGDGRIIVEALGKAERRRVEEQKQLFLHERTETVDINQRL